MFHKLSFQKWIFSKAVKKTLLAEYKNDKIVRLLDKMWNHHENIPESSAKGTIGLLLPLHEKVSP